MRNSRKEISIKAQKLLIIMQVIIVLHQSVVVSNEFAEENQYVDVNVIPQVEFQISQQQFGNENQFSFQLNSVHDFYQINLSKRYEYMNNNATNQSPSSSGDEQNNPSSPSSSNQTNINKEAQQCSLSVEGGDFESVDNFDIYQNIIGNVLQITRSDNEYYYFYLDSLLQLYTYRVNTKRESLKYLGHKKIEFEDFVLNTQDTANLLRNLVNIGTDQNNTNFSDRNSSNLLRRHLQESRQQEKEVQKEEQSKEQTKFQKQSENLDEQYQQQYEFEEGDIVPRNLGGEEKDDQRGSQQITFLKLLQWKEQIICVLNTSLYVIIQDKGYKIAKIDNLLDADTVDDFLFVALGNEGLKVYEFQQGIAQSQQPMKDIQLKRISSIKWKDQNVRQIRAVKDRIYFVNRDSIYIYLIQGNQINFGCMISENELQINRSIEKIYSYSNTIVVLTELKVNDDQILDNNVEKLKGYQEYLLNTNALNTNSQNGQANNQNLQNEGFCYQKMKEETDLPNNIKQIQIDDQYIYFGLENGIHGVNLRIKSQFLNQITKNKWTNNFIPNISHLHKIEDSSYFIIASGNRFSLFNLHSFNLSLSCNADKLLDEGKLTTFNGESNVQTSTIEYQVTYITNYCKKELSKQTEPINKIKINFNKFKKQFGYPETTQYEEIEFLNSSDSQTCLIMHQIVLKQLSSNFGNNHGFMIGMICAIVASMTIFLVAHYFYKRHQMKQDTSNANNKKKRSLKPYSQKSSTDDSTTQVHNQSLQKQNSKSSSQKKESQNINNNSSSCILAPTKSTKNQSGIFEDENNHHNQSQQNEQLYNQNQQVIQNSRNQQQNNNQNQKDYQPQQQLDQKTQQMLYISQQEQYQFIQQILQNQQFQQLSKYEQDRFLQHQYQQHLEYQKQIRMQQQKQSQKVGNNGKIISPLQRKYGGGVDPILETDSDKKISTRRDQEAFYRMKKRNNHFEENLFRSYQKNIDVINDLNLNIQLEDNSQPPNHNVFSPQNFGKFQIEIENDDGQEDQILSNNLPKYKDQENISQFQNDEEIVNTENQQIQNPPIPFMTLQSIQNSLKIKQSNKEAKDKLYKSIPKKVVKNKKYQKYEDEDDNNNNQEVGDNQNNQENQKGQFGNNAYHQDQINNEDQESKINQELVSTIQYGQKSNTSEKEKNSPEFELKTYESQSVSDKMTRSNIDTTSTASNRPQKAIKQSLKQIKKEEITPKTPQTIDREENQEDEYYNNGNGDNNNTLNDDESNQDERQLNDHKNQESQ